MPLALRGGGEGQVGEKLLLNSSKPLRGLLRTESTLAAPFLQVQARRQCWQQGARTEGCQAQVGAAGLLSRSLAPHSSPAISAAALHPLLWQSSTGGCRRTRIPALPPPRGLCDQYEISSFPVPPASPPVSAISSAENSHIINFKQSEIGAG